MRLFAGSSVQLVGRSSTSRFPQSQFATVVESLGQSGNASGAKLILEKPFGRDLESARALDATLHTVFEESAVSASTTYPGKEAVQNLLGLSIREHLPRANLNRHFIESVQITMAETLGVEGRGGFYEEAGAIRDVIQNHMLQVVSFLAMEPPNTAVSESIRDEQVKDFGDRFVLSPE